MKIKNIILHPVKGSVSVSKYGYDAGKKVLAVQFNSTKTPYYYHGVEQKTVDNLIAAESFGKSLQANVVGKYPQTKPGHNIGDKI